jgi:A/G-specific adenine glycosylase
MPPEASGTASRDCSGGEHGKLFRRNPHVSTADLMRSFAAKVINWQKRHGRHDLPWQGTCDPYAIWIAEVMLQQTQVTTVIPYYRRFCRRFPDVAALAAADLDTVLVHWSGLGYYSRARNLHRAAQIVAREHGGRFPSAFEAVHALPGIGRSTAAAICAFAFGARQAILDGNVKRVFARYFAVRGYPGNRREEEELWRRAERLLPAKDIAAYTQGLMDLGANVCTRGQPLCAECPLRSACIARRRGLTAQLPAPRPRKRLPHRETTMLILQHAGDVLLEKRPAPGIWGGLWCLPEIRAGEPLEQTCRIRFGAHLGAVDAMPTVEHGFTHFSLTIRPRRVRVTRVEPRAGEPGLIWLPVDDARSAAVPAPVRRILAGLSANAELA